MSGTIVRVTTKPQAGSPTSGTYMQQGITTTGALRQGMVLEPAGKPSGPDPSYSVLAQNASQPGYPVKTNPNQGTVSGPTKAPYTLRTIRKQP